MSRFWTMIVTFCAALVLIAVAGLPLYVFPPIDDVRVSDAALVLGPPMQERLDVAESLYDAGTVDEIVISVQPSGGQTADDLELCREDAVTCTVPDPFTTRGEVLMMTEHGGTDAAPSAIVVTATAHVARTRYIFDKCYPGQFSVIAADRPMSLSEWGFQYIYQSLAFVKAAIESCPEAPEDVVDDGDR